MNVYVLTNPDCFDFVYETTYPYKDKHQIHISTQPYVLLSPYDIGISFMHQYKVLAKEVNSHTWINFHPGPLPEYKGRNLCYHAIMNGEEVFGTSVHYMDEGFDTGDIIDVTRFLIEPHWTAEDLHNKVMDVSKRIFREFLPRILEGEEFERLPNRGGTYYKKSEITEKVHLHPDAYFSQFIRAVTFKQFYPKVNIAGVTYKIVKDE